MTETPVRWFSTKAATITVLLEDPQNRFEFLRGVPFATSPVGRGHVMFDEELARRLTAAGASVKRCVPLEFEGIEHIEFDTTVAEPVAVPARLSKPKRPAKPTEHYEVTLDNLDGDFNEETMIQIVSDTLAPVVKRHIVVKVPHGGPPDDGELDKDKSEFIVWVWSSPSRTGKKVEVPRQMWGTQVSCHDNTDQVCYPEDSDNYEYITTPEGHRVAAINPYNLFIFFDAVHYHNDDSVEIMKKLCEQAALTYEKTKMTVEVTPEDAKRASQFFKEKYIKACMDRVNYDFFDLQKQVKEFSEALERNRAEMLSLTARRSRAEKSLSVFPEAKAECKDKFAAEWDALLRVPKVFSARCSDTKLTVMTDVLYIQHSKKKTWHKIGKLRIVITFSGNIRFFRDYASVATRMGGMIAPHVFRDGHACFGTVESTVREMLKAHEYAALVQLLLVFLNQANVNDPAGVCLEDFPVVSEEEATGKKPKKTTKKAA